MPGDAEFFTAFHRQRARATAAKAAALALTSAALFVSLSLLSAAAPSIRGESINATPAVAAVPAGAAVVTPLSRPAPSPAAPPDVTPVADPAQWSVDVDVVGYQAELDACNWVRMDLGAAAPIVGAHNHCGGGIILDMSIGDTVVLHGTGLDGSYLVQDSRDATAGQNAQEATHGMAADVILQTCYWHSNGRERLLSLIRSG